MSYRQTPSTRLYTLLTAALYGQLIVYVGSGLGGSLCMCVCVWTGLPLFAGEKTALFAPFIYKMHYFTKTGSGQT
jgi:hypothetical protein